MNYALQILRRAQKQLAGLTGSDYERVKSAIQTLRENPRPSGCKKLVARPGWRVRAGHYRIVFEIDDNENVVTILDVAHRRDVYR